MLDGIWFSTVLKFISEIFIWFQECVQAYYGEFSHLSLNGPFECVVVTSTKTPCWHVWCAETCCRTDSVYLCVPYDDSYNIYLFIFLVAGTLIICHWPMRPIKMIYENYTINTISTRFVQQGTISSPNSIHQFVLQYIRTVFSVTLELTYIYIYIYVM